MGDSYWWSSILRNIRLASDLIRVKHDVKLLPRFDLSLMRTDQNDTKLVMVLTTSAIPVKGNVIYGITLLNERENFAARFHLEEL